MEPTAKRTVATGRSLGPHAGLKLLDLLKQPVAPVLLQGLPVYSIAGLPFSSHDLRAEEATPHRTDCTSAGGLIALNGAGPDTNRSAGLHSVIVVAIVARRKADRVHLLLV